MFSIKNINCITYNNNIVYCKKESRPSKSLLNCDKYKKYIEIDRSLNINNYLSQIKKYSKPIEYVALHEIISKMKIFNDYKNSLVLSYDTIIINELNESVLIFSLESSLSIKLIINNILNVSKIIDTDNYLIINYINLFSVNSVELLMLLSQIFKKIKIFYSKVLQQNILICCNYIYNNNLLKHFHSIFKKCRKNYNIKQLNLQIDTKILKNVINYNNNIFDYYININNKINNLSIINEKEYIFNNYLKVLKIIKNDKECIHCFTYSYIYECYICKGCYELFNLT